MTFNEFMKSTFGVKSCTTFWDDFSIADRFGINAVKDTYKRSKYWISDVKMWTELCIVLNKRCWQHYSNGNNKLSEVYSELYYKARDLALDTFKEKDFEYFYRMTD